MPNIFVFPCTPIMVGKKFRRINFIFGAECLSRFVMRSADLVMPISRFLKKYAITQELKKTPSQSFLRCRYKFVW